MIYRLETAAGKQPDGLRKETVEPVFGIINEAIGFRRLMLPGLEKAGLECPLLTENTDVPAPAVRFRVAEQTAAVYRRAPVHPPHGTDPSHHSIVMLGESRP